MVFLILFLPLYAISFIVTATGAWLALAGGVYMGGRGLTQYISYPGTSMQIQRSIEKEYSKNVSSRLVGVACVGCGVSGRVLRPERVLLRRRIEGGASRLSPFV